MKKKMIPGKWRMAAVFAMLAALLTPSFCMGAKIAVFPFNIHAPGEYRYLKDAAARMLASRLAWEKKVYVIPYEDVKAALSEEAEITKSTAVSAGKRAGADHFLFGSITLLGKSASIDATLINDKNASFSFFRQAKSLDDIIPAIDAMAAEINLKVFGRQPEPVAASETKPADTSIYRHPEKLLREQQLGAGEGSAFVMNRGFAAESDFWKSPSIKDEIISFAAADVDADKKVEAVFASSGAIYIYRLEKNRFLKLYTYKAGARIKILSVDCADLIPGGGEEIYVTAMDESNEFLNSFVLRHEAGTFTVVAENLDLFFRAIDSASRGRLLLGQKKGIIKPFAPPVFEIAYDGGSFVPAAEVALPASANVYSFAWGRFTEDGSQQIISYDKDDRLRLFDSSLKQEWKSDERFGGSEKYLSLIGEESSMYEKVEPGKDDPGRRRFLPARIAVIDVNRDSKDEIITTQNSSGSGRLFENYRMFSTSRFVSLFWDGLGMAEFWRTRKVSGYISDFQVADIDSDGTDELCAVVVKRRSSPVSRGKSSMIVYELSKLGFNAQKGLTSGTNPNK